MIRIDRLQKSFGALRAVVDLSFEVARGEVVGLLGPNGAGKTTTMRIATGYLAADGGAVTVDGIPVAERPVEARRRIGYLAENAPLYDDLEVTSLLDYVGRLRGMAGRERSDAIEEMVATCGLAAVVGRPVGALSKGYRQRVGLAAAMLHRPPILILDEPTSGLDPNQIQEIRALITAIGRERTVVLSTHILQEVEATCGRALIIDGGRLVGEGSIDELVQRRGSMAGYRIALADSRDAVERALTKLAGFTTEWRSAAEAPVQRLVLTTDRKEECAGELFRWAVAEGLTLTELTRESASLEEVFRELTQTT